MKQIRNERLRQTATFLSNIAVAILGIGALTPLLSIVMYRSGGHIVGPGDALLVVLVCVTVAGILHLEAMILLGRLE